MTALEGDMSQIREEWKVVAQTPLIQTRLLNALRETQVEHSKTLVEHSRTLAEHGRMLAEHSADLHELKQGQQMIVRMLTTLIERE